MNEVVHKDLKQAVNVNGVKCDAIDFRFEDWKRGLNPQKSGDRMIPHFSPSKFMLDDFSVPLNNGKFLNFRTEKEAPIPSGMDFSAWKKAKAAGQNVGGMGSREIISMSPQPESQTINNPHWWNFAIAYLNGEIVKEPEWPRDGETRAIIQPVRARKVASL